MSSHPDERHRSDLRTVVFRVERPASQPERIAEFPDIGSAGESEPESCAYLVAHTLEDRSVVCLERHIARLKQSAEGLEYTVGWSSAEIRQAIWRCLEASRLQQAKFRLVATRRGALRIAVAPYAGLDPAVRRSGVDCVTVAGSARSDATTKSTTWMHRRGRLPGHVESAYEQLLLDSEGYVLEGSGSNVFFVEAPLRDTVPVLRTAGDGVLEGISRRIVLEVAADVCRTNPSAVHADRLSEFREAFLTSSTRGIVPIRAIDSVRFAAPGELTEVLIGAYDRWVERHSEPLSNLQ